MATICRYRAVLRNYNALQLLMRNVAPSSSKVLCNTSYSSICNKRFHSLNLSKSVSVLRPPVAAVTCVRHYAELPQITFAELEARAINVLKLFDKVQPEKVEVNAKFIDDMGLDSLDVVEIIMAMEDEFAVEINDDEGEKIVTVKDIIELLADKFDTTE